MKVCVISRGDLTLFPPTQGASVKLFYTLKTLSKLGIKTYFVSAEDEYYYEVKKGKFIKRKYPWLIAKSPIRIFYKKILSWLGIPNDIFVLYHPVINFGLWLKILYVMLKEKIDIVQAEFTAFGIPAMFVKFLMFKPVVLVEHNIESFQLPTVTKLSPSGKKIVKIVEKFVCSFSDRIIVMCEEEKRKLIKLGIDENKIFTIPHGIDLNLYKTVDSKKIKKKYELKFPTLVFHGVYSYKPNYDAIKIISEKILPALKKRGVNAKLLAIGDFPPKDAKDPNIIFTGVVKNLPKYIDAADIAVVPLQAGGGIRMKILEYFAAKKPVVSTPKGAEGINAKNGEEIIIADIDDFPREIMKLIKSKALRNKIVKNGFRFVKDYDWKKICMKYVSLYKEII
jgi:glycosyltransferase involved in cell wall biosynthesis